MVHSFICIYYTVGLSKYQNLPKIIFNFLNVYTKRGVIVVKTLQNLFKILTQITQYLQSLPLQISSGNL